MSHTQEILDLVRTVNDCWLGGRYDELKAYFDENMVLAMPGFEQRVEGRGPIIESYRRFAESAKVHRFDAKTPRVDVVGATAVAATNFEIDYELEGTMHRECGTDLLVLHRADSTWRVVWRTVLMAVRRRDSDAAPKPPPDSAVAVEPAAFETDVHRRRQQR